MWFSSLRTQDTYSASLSEVCLLILHVHMQAEKAVYHIHFRTHLGDCPETLLWLGCLLDRDQWRLCRMQTLKCGIKRWLQRNWALLFPKSKIITGKQSIVYSPSPRENYFLLYLHFSTQTLPNEHYVKHVVSTLSLALMSLNIQAAMETNVFCKSTFWACVINCCCRD